ncbi:MAG: DUF3800 domain-containing protein [candidate division Zixibacteria bacterium]|nr:DUF3800 domain-containing protein [candidate division Zixibacteria bacterium]
MNYSFFLDETGDHGLSFIDKNFPLFLLCGFAISEDALKEIEKKINKFKQKYFKTTEIILHSRDIRKCEGVFQILFDLNLKAEFYKDLNKIIGEGDYCLIGSGIQKEEHIKKYGKGAKDPYSLSLSFVLERLIFYLDKIDEQAKVEIFAEERGKREDQMLLSHFNSIMDRGTFYVQPDRFKNRIEKFNFHSKKDNIVGLQIADLCAYPLARHLLNPEEPYIPFKIIERKIYCSEEGQYEGWGLKLFP